MKFGQVRSGALEGLLPTARSSKRSGASRHSSTLSAKCSLQHQGLGAPTSTQTYFKKDLVIPSQLVGGEAEYQHKTVYTVRFSTGSTRGSALDEPYSGVQLCLVGADGKALLHRVSPVFDPQALMRELAAIRRVVDSSIGANCQAIDHASDRINAVPEGKKRFQTGSIDEISFLGPELGPLQSLLVAPETGSWRLEDVTVSSSRTRHTDRFVSGDVIGAKGGAAFLSAVPPDAVVYGSGDATVLLTRDQARALHEAGMGKYSLLKERLIQANMSLVGIGASLAWAFAGEDSAVEFACGGLGGLLYQWLLQKGVDGLSLNTFPLYQKARGRIPGETVNRIVTSGFFRVGLVGFFVACAIYGSRVQEPGAAIHTEVNQVQQVLVGAAGFLMYKLALIGVLTVPPLFHWNQPQEN